MGQKKSFTMSTESILNGMTSKTETPQGQRPQEGQEPKPAKEKNPVGRPRILNHKTTSTSQQGLKDGLTRMTFIISQEKQDKLKYISFYERMSIRQILDEAIDDYINKYEAQVGGIVLN